MTANRIQNENFRDIPRSAQKYKNLKAAHCITARQTRSTLLNNCVSATVTPALTPSAQAILLLA